MSTSVREYFSERGLQLYIPPYKRPYGWELARFRVNGILPWLKIGLGVFLNLLGIGFLLGFTE